MEIIKGGVINIKLEHDSKNQTWQNHWSHNVPY